jgi:hypothetical protein
MQLQQVQRAAVTRLVHTAGAQVARSSTGRRPGLPVGHQLLLLLLLLLLLGVCICACVLILDSQKLGSLQMSNRYPYDTGPGKAGLL